MTYEQAYAALFFTAIFVLLSGWYLWCWYTILFVCDSPREFLSTAYPTSGPFLFVNLVAFVMLGTHVLVTLTN